MADFDARRAQNAGTRIESELQDLQKDYAQLEYCCAKFQEQRNYARAAYKAAWREKNKALVDLIQAREEIARLNEALLRARMGQNLDPTAAN